MVPKEALRTVNHPTSLARMTQLTEGTSLRCRLRLMVIKLIALRQPSFRDSAQGATKQQRWVLTAISRQTRQICAGA